MNKYEEVWAILWTLIFIIFLSVAVFSTAFSSHLVVYDGKWADLADIALIAATLVLTAVAVMIAVAALWGYRELKNAAVAAAVKRASIVATEKATEVTNILVPRLVEARIGEGGGGSDTEDGGKIASAFPRT